MSAAPEYDPVALVVNELRRKATDAVAERGDQQASTRSTYYWNGKVVAYNDAIDLVLAILGPPRGDVR